MCVLTDNLGQHHHNEAESWISKLPPWMNSGRSLQTRQLYSHFDCSVEVRHPSELTEGEA